jgi:sugar/nucleoside kinase (ribokinase family)
MAFVVAVGNPVYDAITTPSITTGGRVLSGCSTNGCLVLARLGHRAALVGSIGPDYAERLLVDTRRYGIKSYLQPSAKTGGFQLVYDPRGDRTLDVLGVADAIVEFPPDCSSADAVILGPILQETSLPLITRIGAATRAPLFLDPQGLLRRIGAGRRIEHYRNQDLEWIAPLCTVVKANELEARIITGVNPRQEGEEAARKLKALGCAIAIVTMAEAGSLIYDGQMFYHIPAYPTLARDPTGAGDTYMAGFIDAYLRNPNDLYYAGCSGAACASIWIEYTGPDVPLEREEVERRIQALHNHRKEDR